MNESLFSTYWYRVKDLKPFLRPTTLISRHIYRGEPWYILQNSLNRNSHRFNADAYRIIGQMDGKKTVQEIWENICSFSADTSPTQDEIIRLLGQLHDADLVQSDILPSSMESLRKSGAAQGKSFKQRVNNPFSMKFSLVDPERFLDKYQFIFSPLFSLPGFLVWLGLILFACITAAIHWTDITHNVFDRLFSLNTLLALWVTYPFVKLIHEFGHAWAIKKWGGEVHEMGIMLIALTPIPYVDASASAAFPDKRHRILVAAMGMMVELMLAAIALLVWLNVEPGIISSIAYSVMMISGVSAILFNGNPLLRYDGYFMLSDLIEIPNLSQRSTRYIGYLLQRYLFRIDTAQSPVTAPGEKIWFAIYGPISFCYRIMILTWLIWMFSDRFFIIGILIAIWGTATLLVIPAVKTTALFLSQQHIQNRRPQFIGMGIVTLIGLGLFLFIYPMPFWTTAQGVVWLPEQATIRSQSDCEIVNILSPTEKVVTKGTPLIAGQDFFLESEIEISRQRLNELYATYHAQPLEKRVERKLILEEIQRVKGDLKQIEDKLKQLEILSPAAGSFTLVNTQDLTGRFMKKGELLGYIIPDEPTTVRAVVRQADIDLVRNRVTGLEVRLAEQIKENLPAQIKRIVPAADFNLPSAALGTGSGGIIPVDPTDPEGLRALDTIFQVDIQLPEQKTRPFIGGRAYIRFDHGTLPLAFQWYRDLRQLFLRKFYV